MRDFILRQTPLIFFISENKIQSICMAGTGKPSIYLNLKIIYLELKILMSLILYFYSFQHE